MKYLKNDILNRLIRFLLKHCSLYIQTSYAFIDKLSIEELKWFMNKKEEYKKEIMIHD